MFHFDKVPERVVSLKLSINEEILCALILCRGDLRSEGLFRRSKLIDPVTEKEGVAVYMPIRIINQIDLQSGDISSLLLLAAPHSNGRIHIIPYDDIVGVVIPIPEVRVSYLTYLKTTFDKQKELAQNGKQAVTVKTMMPAPTEIQ